MPRSTKEREKEMRAGKAMGKGGRYDAGGCDDGMHEEGESLKGGGGSWWPAEINTVTCIQSTGRAPGQLGCWQPAGTRLFQGVNRAPGHAHTLVRVEPPRQGWLAKRGDDRVVPTPRHTIIVCTMMARVLSPIEPEMIHVRAPGRTRCRAPFFPKHRPDGSRVLWLEPPSGAREGGGRRHFARRAVRPPRKSRPGGPKVFMPQGVGVSSVHGGGAAMRAGRRTTR